MKRLSAGSLNHPVHRTLWEKDERELYTDNPVDYYAQHYRRRIAAVCALIKRRGAKRVLEIGAAQGNMSLLCAEAGCSCVALDLNFNHLAYSRMKHQTGAVAWVRASADALPFKPACFDAVVLGELLEHCARPETILARAAEMLAPDGVIIITTPNHSYVNGTEKSFSEVSGDRTAIEKHQFGPDGNDHLFTFTESELRQVVASAGLRVVGLRYLGSHFLHLRSLYHLRVRMPFLFNRFLEWVVPHIPHVRRRFTSIALVVVDKGGRQGETAVSRAGVFPVQKIVTLVSALSAAVLIGCAANTTGYGPNFEPQEHGMIRLGILTPEIIVFDVSSGGVPEYRVDWSTAGKAALAGPVTRELARWGFTGIPLPDSAGDSALTSTRKALRLHCDIISRYLYGKQAFLPQIERFDYAIGDITPLCDRFGLDGVLFLYGFDEHFSEGRRRMLKGMAAAKTARSACLGIVFLPLTGTLYYRQYRLPMERTSLCAIVASRDGSIVWFNKKMAADDADLRDGRSLPEYLQSFLTIRRKK